MKGEGLGSDEEIGTRRAFSIDALFNQLQRSSLSVQLNIAEGYTYGNSPTFTKHLGIAYGSAVETGELLRLAVEADLLEARVVAPLLERNLEAEHIPLALLKKRRKFNV